MNIATLRSRFLSSRGTRLALVTALAGAVLASCDSPAGPGALASITVTPNATLAVTATEQFTAVGKDAAGTVVEITPTWTVVAGGGTIGPTGVFTAGLAIGSFAATVTATSGGVSGTASVIVVAGPLASIDISPSPQSLAISATQQFAAVGKDIGGNVVAATPSWSVVAGGGAINSTGMFTAGTVTGIFTGTVRAASGAVVSNATVTVTVGPLTTISISPSPDTLAISSTRQYSAVGKDAGGNVVSVTPTWSVVAGGGAINGSGLFTAETTLGTFANTVRATSGSVIGSATVTVKAGPLATITVTPNLPTMAINATELFTAVGKDAGGNVVAITPTWGVFGGGGAISATGLFTAGTTPGTYTNTVQATSGSILGAVTVTVVTGPLAMIEISPNPGTLAINAPQQFAALGKDAGGNVLAIAPTWSVVVGGGAVSATGLFTAGTTPGTFTNGVRATSGGVVGEATVIVTVGALATIDVTPNPHILAINGTRQFAAVGKDAGGNELTISPTWSVVAGGGTISANGLFTAGTQPGNFTNTVQATSGGVIGAADVTVTVGPLATITVTPNPRTLAINATQQFTAVGRDAGNNVVAVTPAWTVVAGGGTINGGGLFAAGTTPGTYTNTVNATSGGIVGTATVVVTVGPLANVIVTPNPATLVIGATQQFSAVGRDAASNVVSISPTWSVVSGGGTISASGLFTAGTTPGNFASTVRATSGSVFGSADVNVSVGPLATITITPNPKTLAINTSQQFTAVGRDAGNNIIVVNPAWTVVAGGGAINTMSGLFTAGTTPGGYTNTVRATSGSVFGSATVIVTVGPLAIITVTPNPTTLEIGATQQFSAAGKDAANNAVAISPTWSVVASGGGIDAAGLFTAGATPGTFSNTVQATSGAISGNATVTVNPAPSLVDLGAAATHGILAATSISCVASGTVDGDVSVSPGATVTGFPLCTNTGSIHSGDAYAATAQTALTAAYNQVNAMACDVTVVADLGGTTVTPGVHCSATSLSVTGALIIDAQGDANASFVFKAGSTLLTAASATVSLVGGAQAKNIYWLVGSSATLGTGGTIKGNVMALTSITIMDGTTLAGRALARNGAVSLGNNNIISLP